MTETVLLNLIVHSQMSILTAKCPYLWTFDHELYVYVTEMQFYEQMTVKHLFIIQGTGYLIP
jgi:hypothetical protein